MKYMFWMGPGILQNTLEKWFPTKSNKNDVRMSTGALGVEWW